MVDSERPLEEFGYTRQGAFMQGGRPDHLHGDDLAMTVWAGPWGNEE